MTAEAPADQLPIEQLRSVARGDVYKAGKRAGTLTRDRDDVIFTYTQGYLSDDAAPPIAFTLPKTPEPVHAGAGAVPPFFAGLLPEGIRLNAITAATRTSEDDHLTLLLAVGADTIGDVAIVPAGSQVTPPRVRLSEADLKATSLPGIFSQLLAPASGELDRIAIPGIQEKMSALMMSTPLDTTGGPAILKLNPPGYPRMVENEAFFLRMADAAGLTVPEFRLVSDRDRVSGLLLARFDRVRAPGGRHGERLRLPQEDACQVMGRYPAAKYRIKYEDATRALADAVERVGGSAALAVRQSLELAAFSYVIGNGDLHAKNISIQRNARGTWQLTPAYDLLSTQPYLSWRDPMALPLYGRANKLSRRWWLDAAARLKIPDRAMARRVDDIAEVAAQWAERVGEIGFDDKTTARLAQLLRTRSEQLRRTN